MGLIAWLTRPRGRDRLSAAGDRVPRHLAIIMDGNGRWAQRRGLPRSAGHRAGLDRIEEILAYCRERGIAYLTLYAFSTENWRRSEEEVGYLMQLFAEALTNKTPELLRTGVRVRFIGRTDRLPAALVRQMALTAKQTESNAGVNLILAIDYGARDELIQAVRRLATSCRSGQLDPERIDESLLAGSLYTAGIPDPDLIIRTSGEERLSNFLLWQGAYAELWFTKDPWPSFGRPQLSVALEEYARRERRFGKA